MFQLIGAVVVVAVIAGAYFYFVKKNAKVQAVVNDVVADVKNDTK